MKQFLSLIKLDIILGDTSRLEKYVERLVSFELEQQNNISILAENVQVQEYKRAFGELGCILLRVRQTHSFRNYL